MSPKSTSVTLALEGQISSESLAAAVVGFVKLIKTLSREVAREAEIEWFVEDLSAGSLSATLVGESKDVEVVERVVKAYANVGRAVAENIPVPYSELVQKDVEKIIDVLNTKVKAVRFETPSESVTVNSKHLPEYIREENTVAIGAVEGIVETLSSRRDLRFTLYDSLNDRAVVCHLHEGQEDIMRNAWGKRVIVQGVVSRDYTGRPLSISRVTEVIPVIAGDYRRARGVLKMESGQPMPEDVIRRMRDA